MSDKIPIHQLLIGNQTIEEWWTKNGLNHEEARQRRKVAYLQQLKDTAIIMDRYHADTDANKD